MENQNNIIAAFDFDKTLSCKDTTLHFLAFTCGYPKLLLGLFLLIPSFIGYLIRLRTREELKIALFTQFLGGMPLAQLEGAAAEYAKTKIDPLIQPKARERLQWHQKQGHRCIMISASNEHYLIPWGKENGFEVVLATQLEEIDGKLTGRLNGSNCRCAEKVHRLTNYLKMPREEYTLYAYGDSRGDAELLAFADYPAYRSF